MDQRSTKANAKSQRTMDEALFQPKLYESFAERKASYYIVLLSSSLNHITALFFLDLFFCLYLS